MSVTTECINNVINRQAVLSNIPSAINDAFELDETENSDYSDEIENSENLDENNVVEFNVAGAIPGKCEVIPENSALNIENCSDVIIGPVTQFHGPVTINYQDPKEKKCIENLNGKFHVVEDGLPNGNIKTNLVKSESASSDGPATSEKGFSFQGLRLTRLKLIVLMTAISILLISLATYFTITSLTDIDNPPNTDVTPSEPTESPSPPVPQEHPFLERDRWGGRPRLNNTVPLKHPVKLVVIIHTVTPFCKTFTECAERVQSMQSYHVQRFGSPDIGYNFIVGGDGNIYVGRGWDIVNFSIDKTITIAFIGNFIYDILTKTMEDAAKVVLEVGVKKKKLAEDYIVVCHNQTTTTDSPGPNVYKVVKHWPHFKPGLVPSQT